MTMFVDINNALSGRLNAMAGLPPVAWENKAYDPEIGTLYLRVTNIQGDTQAFTQGSVNDDLTIGIYQIDVFAEAGSGRNDALVMADKVAIQFKMDTEISSGTALVRVRSASRGAAINNPDGWYQVPVLITYDAYSTRR